MVRRSPLGATLVCAETLSCFLLLSACASTDGLGNREAAGAAIPRSQTSRATAVPATSRFGRDRRAGVTGLLVRQDAKRQSAVAGVATYAASQVRRCYRTPRVASEGKQIATRVRVRFQPDGSLSGLPVVVTQTGVTPENQSYASKMAEAAGMAVVRCTPLKLPPELYADGWNELDFTFSPRRSV